MKDRRLSYTDSDWLIDSGKPISPPSHDDLGWIAGFDPSALLDALERLDDRSRTVIDAYYWERLTYQQIAARLGLAGRQYALYEVKRALRRLKKEMGYEDK